LAGGSGVFWRVPRTHIDGKVDEAVGAIEPVRSGEVVDLKALSVSIVDQVACDYEPNGPLDNTAAHLRRPRVIVRKRVHLGARGAVQLEGGRGCVVLSDDVVAEVHI
jgi:hypothetical protein